jgi:Kef-type K+ transport system membrane component KefB
VSLVVVLLLVPRALQRARIPPAISALLLGIVAGLIGVDVGSEQVVHLLSTLGIASLFLFAGMEVDLHELRRGARVVSGHLVVQAIPRRGGRARSPPA